MTDMTNATVKRNDQFAWGLAAVPFVYLAMLYINEIAAGAVSVVLTVMFILQDRKALKAEGLIAPSKWWMLFSFGYLYRRGKLNNIPQWKKIAWIVTIVYLGAVVATTAYDVSDTSDAAADQYCATVSEIISQRRSSVTCLKVKDIAKVSDKNYRAVAMLSNGNDVKITIEYKDSENFYVTAYGL